jgi:hypothetical protein
MNLVFNKMDILKAFLLIFLNSSLSRKQQEQ